MAAMIASLLSKLSDANNPGTVPAWAAALLAVFVLLAFWRCLLPQWRALRRRRTSSRGHRSAVLAARQKHREQDPPGTLF